MRNKFLLYTITIVFLFAAHNLSHAQFQVGKHYAGPSLGLSFLGSTVQFGLNYEYAIQVKDIGTIGIGGIFRYWSYSEGYYSGKWSYTDVLIGAQGNYHFKLDNNKIDPWVGLILAYDAGSVDWDGTYSSYAEPSYGGLWLGLQGGARYWLSPTLALTGRFGFGTLSYGAFEVGVDFKF